MRRKGKKVRKLEDKFDTLARLIKEESDDVQALVRQKAQESEDRLELRLNGLERLTRKVDEAVARIDRRLDDTLQPQLDDHAHRIKKLETKVFS